MASINITSTNAATAERHAAIRAVQRKRRFWRHVSLYVVLNLAFWTSWIIAGIHEQWIAPWPLLPTLIWGLFIIGQEYRLGGPSAVSHATIEHEVYDLAHPDEPVFIQHPVRRPILYSDSASMTPIRRFHLSEVIDARDPERRRNEDTAATHNHETPAETAPRS